MNTGIIKLYLVILQIILLIIQIKKEEINNEVANAIEAPSPIMDFVIGMLSFVTSTVVETSLY